MTDNSWGSSTGPVPRRTEWGSPTGAAADTSLDDLFADDAPTAKPAENNDLDDLFADPAPSDAGGAVRGDLDDLFADDVPAPAASGGLDDLFAAPAAPVSVPDVPVDDLDDLFGGVVPEPSADLARERTAEAAAHDALGDIFAEPEAPRQEEEAVEEAADAAAAEIGIERVTEAPSGATASEDSVVPESKSDDEPVRKGWRASPPVLGQSLRPTRKLDLPGRAVPAPRPAPVEAVAPEVTESKPESTATVVEDASGKPTVQLEDQGDAVPASPVTATPDAAEESGSDGSAAEVASATETPAPETEDASAEEAAEAARTTAAVAESFRARALEAERAQLSAESMRRLAEQAELERQARRYDDVDRLWNYVDRIMSVIATNSLAQGKINRFELTRDRYTDDVQRRELIELVTPLLASAGVSVGNPQDAAFVMEMLYDELIGISVLGELWRDDEITEIMVDRWNKIVVERSGVLVATRLSFRSAEHASSIARSLAQRISDRAVSKSNPLVTAELPGARVTFCYGPVVRGGLSITIRKFRPLLSFSRLLELGSLNTEMAEFLEMCVRARATVLVSGGTGTGKTTVVNLLSSFIPPTERVVTIEDAFELALSNSNWVPLQTKEKASADDEVAVTLADLLRQTLRMRPDRVIVGEIREYAGAEVMIQAANTGHDGTMTTIHANSGELALNDRLAVLLRQGQGTTDEIARKTIASAFQLVVQVTRAKGRRFISEISVVDRSGFTSGSVVPQPVFTGSIGLDGQVSFRRVGGVRPDTELYNKLVDTGFDLRNWES